MKKLFTAVLTLILLGSEGLCFADTTDLVSSDNKVSSKGDTFDYVLTGQDEYKTDDCSQYDFGFQEEIEVDGTEYKLSYIEYNVQNKYEELYGTEEIETVKTAEEEIDGELKDSFSPDDSITEDGFTYELSDVSFVLTDNGESVTMQAYDVTVPTNMSYEDVDAPETYLYMYADREKEYELPVVSYERINLGWYDCTLDGKVINYDAPTYIVGDMELLRNTEKLDVAPENYSRLLKNLGYDPEVYRVDSIEFDGEPYTKDGIVYRNYIVKGQFYGWQYKSDYEAVIEFPVYNAVSTYNLSDSDMERLEELKETYEVTAYGYYLICEEEPEPEVKEKKLSTPVKVAIGIGILVGIILIIALVIYIVRGGRRKTEIMSNREARDEYEHLK